MATESPKYEVLKKYDGFEVRQYAGYVVAETEVEASRGEAGNQAFGRLAGYIFGGNTAKQEIAMTAPVTQSQRIAMTSPVTQVASGSKWVVQFSMPSSWTMQTLPVPNDARHVARGGAEDDGRPSLLRHLVRGELRRAPRHAEEAGDGFGPDDGRRAGVGPVRPAVHAVVHAHERSAARARAGAGTVTSGGFCTHLGDRQRPVPVRFTCGRASRHGCPRSDGHGGGIDGTATFSTMGSTSFDACCASLPTRKATSPG